MKTKTVKFSYGTVKDASLEIPAEACSIMDIVKLVHKSYLTYMFRPGCGLMSDECLTSSIGQANFFAGALGGFETRLDAKTFTAVKEWVSNELSLACEVVKFRNPSLTQSEVYMQASKNEVLSKSDREALVLMAGIKL